MKLLCAFMLSIASRSALPFRSEIPACRTRNFFYRKIICNIMTERALGVDRNLALAPMMDYTDCHMRFLLRLLTKKMIMWTEMIPIGSIIHNPEEIDRFLGYNQNVEHPIVLQIGGSDPELIRTACQIAKPYKYDELNLNVGCPSERVAGKGSFGAALMREPDLVASICRMMEEGGDGTPVSVKCRIGVDDDDSYEFLKKFVSRVSMDSNVKHFVIHARKAILKGLSPHQNRIIPPLKHEYVYQLVRDFPGLRFTLNGGIKSYSNAYEAIEMGAQGVMVGRDILERPWYWSQTDSKIYGTQDSGLCRRMVLQEYCVYANNIEQEAGDRLINVRRFLLKPVWNLFHGESGGRKFRTTLNSILTQERSFSSILNEAMDELPSYVLDSVPGEGKTFD